MKRNQSDTSQKLRIGFVWQAVEQLGRSGVQEICVKVAAKMGVAEVTTAFKRNIYRDLGSLVQAGEIGVDHFLPDGSRFHPDESGEMPPNFRSEYFSNEKDAALAGGELLNDFGARFYVPQRALVHWRVTSVKEKLEENTFQIFLTNSAGNWVSLSAGRDQCPFQIIIARNESGPSGKSRFDEIKREAGARASLLLLDSNSVSRGVANGRLGHIQIELRDDSGSVWIRDLGSSAGTLAAPVQPEFLRQTVQSHADGKTLSLVTLESLAKLPFQKIGGEESECSSHAVIVAGTYFFMIALS